jgi:transposase
MEVVVVVGAGLDIHKKTVVACCLDGRSNPPTSVTCTFGTFRDELERLREWLIKRECTHVAMESTGVYWMPVYRVLEDTVQIVLGNARHMANVPGRKTDMSDALWIAKLLRHGLIRPNFVPPRVIRDLRQLTRYRRKLVQTTTACQLRIEKLLQSTNIKLSSVASNVFGVSGRLMLAALAAGKTDPVKLAALAKGTLTKKKIELTRAFRGTFGEEHARLLKIELSVLNDMEKQLARLDALIEASVAPFARAIERIDTVPGIDHTLATDLIAEIGTDMSAWPSAGHFAAWSGTCPGNRETGGIRRRAPVREGNPYVKTLLIQAAVCASKTVGSYLATRYRRLAARRGPRRAAVAVARHIGVAIYHMLSRDLDYSPPKTADPTVLRNQRHRQLVRQLQKLGFEVTCTPINA